MSPVNIHRGHKLEVTGGELVAGGASLVRIEGLPLFVHGIFPGDLAVIEVTETKKGYARGELIEVVAPGPLRREEPCPIAQECGGCDWTSLRLDHQLAAKEQILVETLRRIGKFDSASLPPIRVHPSPLNYRLRSRLHRDQATGAIGFFGRGSNDVVPLSDACEVVGPHLREAIDRVAVHANDKRASAVETFETDQRLAVTPVEAEPLPLSISVREFRYRLTSRSFFQVNRHLLGTLIDLVMRDAQQCRERDLAFDLYGGVGFFALPLAGSFARVVTVESDPISSRFARENTHSVQAVTVVQRRVEDFLAGRRDKPRFVVIDPPRAGASLEVIGRIGADTGERISYLSCDPVTFARDAMWLASSGWQLVSLDLVDLFPNTHHIETFGSFVRT